MEDDLSRRLAGELISCIRQEALECRDVSVFGIADDRLGEVPLAIIHVKSDSELDEPALRAFLEGRLAAFKVPGRMIFSAEPLPRLGTGKIDRVALKAQYAS